MSDTTIVSQRLDSILAFLEESIKNGAALMQEQTPDIVQQLLSWKFYESVITCAGFGFVLAITIGMSIRSFYKVKDGSFDDSFFEYMGPTVWPFLSVLMAMGFFSSFAWVQIWVAPKVYLLEYASSLIK